MIGYHWLMKPSCSVVLCHDSIIDLLMWVKQCHKPPMTANGKHTTYKNGDLGMVYIVLTTLY